MTFIDWSIVGLYLLVATGVGLYFSKKASTNTADFFVASRSLPWWIAGTSIVATTFSTDTPLFVAGLARNEGVHGNWFWWSLAIGQTATIFFFAKLWQRTGALTDIEFVVQRYDASLARSVLRVFKVLFDGVFVNCVVMASVTLAATKVIQVILGLSSDPVFTLSDPVFNLFEIGVTPTALVLLTLATTALIYSVASGLYGVVYTDLIQFGMAMLGSFWLAIVAYTETAGEVGFVEKLRETEGFKESLIHIFPDLSAMDMLTFTFLVYVMVNWWVQAPGQGYLVQRLLATKSEKDAMLGFLWYNFCHYVLRPWPWIIVGLASMVYFPELTGADAELSYPSMINEFLGPGIKGIMVTAMLAAYMSTVDTHLNWGASYLVNDIYQPFIKPKADAKHYVLVSRLSMLGFMILAALVTTLLTGILDAYKYLAVITAGVGSVQILRWYWWRVSAWSEIVSIIAACVIGNAVELYLLKDYVDPVSGEMVNMWGMRMLVTAFGTAAIWIAVTLMMSTQPTPADRDFCKRIRVPGPGWRRVREQLGVDAEGLGFRNAMIGWFLSMGFIFGLLIGLGLLLLGSPGTGAGVIVTALLCGYAIVRLIRSDPELLGARESQGVSSS
ncbi:MAG: sodium:solute symporter family protein [Phycisphaeraceae bacterium]